MAAEHYDWILRLLERGDEVELEIDVAARFHDDDLDAYNVLAEIPGTDRKSEVVMAGAHLDSWHAAAGANDNAAGCAVVMEAARDPRGASGCGRGAPSGSRSGAAKSRVCWERAPTSSATSRPGPRPPTPRSGRLPTRSVAADLAARAPSGAREDLGLLQPRQRQRPHPRDLHPGQRRGRSDLPALARAVPDLGADTVTHRDTGSTDHSRSPRSGIPGFQFVQDMLDYGTRTHHTNLDHFDHAVEDDLKQASVVLASFLYHTAMRDELLPRGAAAASRRRADEDSPRARDRARQPSGSSSTATEPSATEPTARCARNPAIVRPAAGDGASRDSSRKSRSKRVDRERTVSESLAAIDSAAVAAVSATPS